MSKSPGTQAVGTLAVLAVVGLAAAVLAAPFCVAWSVPSGHVGVVSAFGAVQEDTLPPGGPYLVLPWKRVQRLNVQTTKNDEPATVPTKGGLSVDLHAVLLYRLDPVKAPSVVREIGDKFEDKVIDPVFKNAVRDICAEFAAEALYTEARQSVEGRVLGRLQNDLAPRGFVIEQVMIQDPKLPQVVKDRIEAKMGAEQDVQRMEYVLRQKRLEADAKVVEAEGIAKAQAIIQKDLSREYLVYLWISALKEHTGSTIYVPTGSDGLPFFGQLKPAAESPTTKR